jgi:hypothetical protein
MKDKLTYANVMATLAVGLALAGGVAYAVTAPKNSVRSISIKNGQVTARDLAGLRVIRASRPVSDPAQDSTPTYANVEARCRSKKDELISGGGDVAGSGITMLKSSQPVGGPAGIQLWSVSGGVDGGSAMVTSLAICLRNKP